jgi:hypothetical protein
MNNPDHISEKLEKKFLGLKYLNSLVRIRDPGWEKFGSGIRNKHLGSATLLWNNSNLTIFLRALRCMAAKQRLTKGRAKARQRKMHLIGKLTTFLTVHRR